MRKISLHAKLCDFENVVEDFEINTIVITMDTLANGFNDNIFLPKIEQDMYPKAAKLVIQTLRYS